MPPAGSGTMPPPASSLPPGDLDSVLFDPKEYIRSNYQTMDFSTFSGVEVAGMDNREHEADLAIKQLVQTHLTTFIECKDSMDALYEKEEELFVGDALNPTKESFAAAVTFVNRTTQTLVDLFGRLQTVEQQDDSLRKLMAVLRVPGALYRACNVRVARTTRREQLASSMSRKRRGGQRRSATEGELRELRKKLASHRRQLLAGKAIGSLNTSSESSSSSEEDDQNSEAEEGTEGRRRRSNNDDDDDEVEPDEIREIWCGIELLRRKITTTAFEEIGSEYDSAVQSLRSAVRFIEEHHDIVTGVSVHAEEDEAAAALAKGGESQHHDDEHHHDALNSTGSTIGGSSKRHTATPHRSHMLEEHQHSDDEGDGSQHEDDNFSSQGVSGAGGGGGGGGAATGATMRRRSLYDHQLFTFRFSHALLCACLYLCNSLHDSIFRTDVADAVQLEHHLDLLLETTIVSVRLRHFCAVIREKLLRSRSTGQALQAVQKALGARNDDSTENDDNNSTTTTVLDQSEVATTKSGGAPSISSRRFMAGGDDMTAAHQNNMSTAMTTASSSVQPQHPVEAYFLSLRHHHSKAIVLHAEKFVREGSKFAAYAAPGRKAEHKNAEHKNSGVATTSEAQQQQFSVDNQSLASPSPQQQTNSSFLLFNADSSQGNNNGRSDNEDDDDGGGGENEEALLRTISLTSNGYHHNDGSSAMAFNNDQSQQRLPGEEDDDDDDLITSAFLREHQPAHLLHISNHESGAGRSGADDIAGRRRNEVERNITLRKNVHATISTRPMLRASVDMLISHSLRVARRHSDRRGVAAAGGSGGKKKADAEEEEDSFVFTPVFGFVEALSADLQSRLVSYWRGLGASVHCGNFDVPVDSNLPLAQAVHGKGLGKGVVPVAVRYAEHQQQQQLKDESSGGGGGVQDDDDLPEVPQLRFVPITTSVPQPSRGGGDDDENESGPLGTRRGGQPPPGSVPLIDISVHAVQRMVQSTSDILQRTLEAFGRHISGNGWLLSQPLHAAGSGGGGAGRVGDGIGMGGKGEDTSAVLDLRCSIAVQVFLNHLQVMLSTVCASFTAMKVAIVETAKKDIITTDAQLNAATQILGAVEDGREAVIKAVMFAAELLVKTFLLSSITVACRNAGNCGSLAPRLLRDSITTCIPVKCFNVFLVFVDRIRDVFYRFDETQDLLANARQQLQQQNRQLQEAAAAAAGAAASAERRGSRRRRSVSGDHSSPPPPPPPIFDLESDQVFEAVAEYNAQLVRQHLEAHLQLVELSIVNLLTVPIDACHLRCHQSSSSGELQQNANNGSSSDQKLLGILEVDGGGSSNLQREVECIADLLCLGNVLPILVLDFVYLPNIATIVFRQLRQHAHPDDVTNTATSKKSQKKSLGAKRAAADAAASSAASEAADLLEQQQWTQERRTQFLEHHGSMLQEMAFVAVESVLGKLVAAAQANVVSIVSQNGFSKPGLDWSRIGPADVRIRPYVIDCMMVAARVQEALAAAEVPALAFAAVLRVLSAMGTALVASFQSGNNVSHFDVTGVPVPAFYMYGLALLELEARFFISTMERLLASCAPVLTLAGTRMASSLGDAARIQLCAEDVMSCTAMVAALVKKLEAVGVGACDQFFQQNVSGAISAKQRKELIETAARKGQSTTRLVVDALSSFLDSAALAVTAAAAMDASGFQGDTSTFAERIQQARKSKLAAQAVSNAAATQQHRARNHGTTTTVDATTAQPSTGGGAAAAQSHSRRVVHIQEPSDESGGEGHETKKKRGGGDAVIARSEGATRNSLRSHRRRGAEDSTAVPPTSESGVARRSLRRSAAASAAETTPAASPAAASPPPSGSRRSHAAAPAAAAAASSPPVDHYGHAKGKRGERFRR
ncbi:Hypothetical protein, putative [Bodo saltans]|uniref:Exocyst complex component EXOC2/Sec5 N-terminal domain-containing protein n=1 Tax=Bodo saltans TaxID=75058 RepID=A0A0S4IW59_BODSA|nr:Hypothetical protein, putative [Bodo saltans]|eukprot:CUG25597.1 Hypothetical protein, putative [Bodo saltans]